MLQSQRYNVDFKRSFLTQGSTEDSCKSNVSKSWVFSCFILIIPIRTVLSIGVNSFD